MHDLRSRTESRKGHFDAVITAIHHRWIMLDHTDFHPATTERASDTGHVHGIPVVSVDEGCVGLLHRVSDPTATQGLTMGQTVRADVDLGRRHRLMRLHSLQHLVFLAFQVRHGRCERQGGHVDDQSAAVVLNQRRSGLDVEVDAIRCWVERVIADDLVISSLARPPQRGRRFWHVDGVGTVACEAKHPARTGEIGRFELVADHPGENLVQITGTLLDV